MYMDIFKLMIFFHKLMELNQTTSYYLVLKILDYKLI